MLSINDARILIVHENSQIRYQIAQELTKSGAERILRAGTGDVAIQKLIEGPFDVVIAAPSFSDLPDWGLVKAIRSGRICSPNLPIVIIHSESETTLVGAQAHVFRVAARAEKRLARLADLVVAEIAGHKKPRVLIIEDDHDTGRFITQALSDLYACDVETRGDTGLDRWLSERHDLVLLDMMLPGMQGGDVLQRIRTEDDHQAVIILTGHGSIDRYRVSLRCGASEYVDKPVSIEVLRSTCEKVLRFNSYHEVDATLQDLHDTLNEVSYRVNTAHDYLTSGLAHNAQFELQGAIGALLKDQCSQGLDPQSPTEGDES